MLLSPLADGPKQPLLSVWANGSKKGGRYWSGVRHESLLQSHGIFHGQCKHMNLRVPVCVCVGVGGWYMGVCYVCGKCGGDVVGVWVWWECGCR